ncbi:hypothetical protein [Bradyrhizobium sp. USDA 4454]
MIKSAGATDVHRVLSLAQLLVAVDRFCHLVGLILARRAADVTLDRAGTPHVLELPHFGRPESEFADFGEVLVCAALGVRAVTIKAAGPERRAASKMN